MRRMTGQHANDQAGAVAKGNKASRGGIWLGGLLGAGMAIAIMLQLHGATGPILTMIRQMPPLVWPSLLILYLVQPLFDFIIFRRLWNLPWAGLEALLGKNVINEVVLGYSGEAYLYLWARRAVSATVTPFSTIKDANIVSALMGNVLTLALAAISVTQLRELDFARQVGPALWSGLIPLGISVGVLFFARRVFSLPPARLAYIGLIHGLRLLAWAGLTIVIWRMALPEAPLGLWIVLLAIRCLVSRIPLIANKDLVFGNLVLLLLGAQAPIAVLLAALALVMLLLHLVVIVGLGAADLIRRSRGPSRTTIGAAASETIPAHD